MIHALPQLVDEWLATTPTLEHFALTSLNPSRYRYQVRCSCITGWWLAVAEDFVFVGTDNCDLNNPPRVYATDPEFFVKLEDLLIKGHIKWKGEFRGRSTQS